RIGRDRAGMLRTRPFPDSAGTARPRPFPRLRGKAGMGARASQRRAFQRDCPPTRRSPATGEGAAPAARDARRPDSTEIPISKRTLFHAIAAILMLAGAPTTVATPPTTLRDAYADAFLFGTAVNADIVSGRDARAQALVPLHFNAITPEHVMKAEALLPEPGHWDFADADALVQLGRRHG